MDGSSFKILKIHDQIMNLLLSYAEISKKMIFLSII